MVLLNTMAQMVNTMPAAYPQRLNRAVRIRMITRMNFMAYPCLLYTSGMKDEHSHVIEYSLKLDSNPEFTASVLAAYARAAYRMNKEGAKGCKTVFDIAPAYLSPKDGAYPVSYTHLGPAAWDGARPEI